MDPNKYATMLAVLISPAVVGILSERLKLDEAVAMEKYILDMFELFHVESEANMIAAIDEYIANRSAQKMI